MSEGGRKKFKIFVNVRFQSQNFKISIFHSGDSGRNGRNFGRNQAKKQYRQTEINKIIVFGLFRKYSGKSERFRNEKLGG